jgi:hypothetical protein
MGRINIVKMAILPKAGYMFNAIPIQIPMTFITDIRKSTLKFILKHKRLEIAKAILRKNSNTEDTTIRLQAILQSHSNKNSIYCHKNRYEDQWNRIEDLDINLHSNAPFIFDKGAKNI